MRWGSLHDFALDCMRFALRRGDFDTLTIVDSDQLALRPGWTERLGECIAQAGGRLGLLGNKPERLQQYTDISAAITAWQEVELWRPFLRRFAGGEDKFVHWTFWPSTVFTSDAARELVRLFEEDQQLQQIMRHSRLWVTEEILFPTLTALLGFEVARSPGSYDFVRYRQVYGQAEQATALVRPDAYWMHPVPRHYDDSLRAAIRARWGYYQPRAGRAPGRLRRRRGRRYIGGCYRLGARLAPEMDAVRSVHLHDIRQPVLSAMRQVPGWLGDDEADLLMTMTDRALATSPTTRAVVEVGSFRGKGTTVLASVVRAMRPGARVWAIDPHDGVVGAIDQGISTKDQPWTASGRTWRAAGSRLTSRRCRPKLPTSRGPEPICLLLVDGLHDYGRSRATSTASSRSWSRRPGAFHDYADYFPGVRGSSTN